MGPSESCRKRLKEKRAAKKVQGRTGVYRRDGRRFCPRGLRGGHRAFYADEGDGQAAVRLGNCGFVGPFEMYAPLLGARRAFGGGISAAAVGNRRSRARVRRFTAGTVVPVRAGDAATAVRPAGRLQRQAAQKQKGHQHAGCFHVNTMTFPSRFLFPVFTPPARQTTALPQCEDYRIDRQFQKEGTSPPTIGAAIRFITSAPVPVLHRTGAPTAPRRPPGRHAPTAATARLPARRRTIPQDGAIPKTLHLI